VFDAATAQMTDRIAPAVEGDFAHLPSGAFGAMSLDGKVLYLVGQSQFGAYDTTTLKQIGWLPFSSLSDTPSTVVPGAVDETGLLVGPTGHGVAFVDVSHPLAQQPSNLYLYTATPATGPKAGGTSSTGFIANGVVVEVPSPVMYLGNAAPSAATFAPSTTGGDEVQLVTPPSEIRGAVDLAVQLPDGATGVAPEVFSYGPAILELTHNASTAEGGGAGTITGYGFGSSASDVQVTVGGKAAVVTTVYAYPAQSPYPVPTTSLVYTIPSGVAGTSVDVTVITEAGSVTASKAFHYVGSNDIAGSARLQAGIYDAQRELYYFTDTAQIQVMDASTGAWLSPISLPQTTAASRLLAISESLDRSKLAISDSGGKAIYVVDPDNPAAAQRFSMPANSPPPAGLAITNSGAVYFMTTTSGFPNSALEKLDIASGAFSYLGDSLSAGGGNAEWNRVLLSPDGKKIYFGKYSTWVDTSTDELHPSFNTERGVLDFFPDLTISGDGSTVVMGGNFSDATYNEESSLTYVDWEWWFPQWSNGEKLNYDGSILYQPSSDGIDLIARNTGRLLYRVRVPAVDANVFDPLLIGKDPSSLGILTGSGITFVDLSTLPIAAKYTRPFLASNEAREHKPEAAALRSEHPRNAVAFRPAMRRRARFRD
jgi:hypothetical protein